MIDQYILGGFVASLFGFVLLYNLRRKMKKNEGSKLVHKDQCIKTSNDGIHLPAVDVGRTDVIIVGAGVAGAALAYTLGKVRKYILIFRNFISIFYHFMILITISGC